MTGAASDRTQRLISGRGAAGVSDSGTEWLAAPGCQGARRGALRALSARDYAAAVRRGKAASSGLVSALTATGGTPAFPDLWREPLRAPARP